MEPSQSQSKSLSPKKSKNRPYTFPQPKLLISISHQEIAMKSQEKTVFEEETTCLSKPAPTFSHDLSQVFSSHLPITDTSKMEILSNLLKLKIQAKKLQQGLQKNKEILSTLDKENSKLSLHKENLHQRLRKKLSRPKNKHGLCFFLRNLFN